MLYIIRGIPGSGKSTFAKKLAKELNCQYFEADQYFTDDKGVYNFDPPKIGAAHAWCFREVEKALKRGNDVIVSNTFIKQWELDKYIEVSKEFKHNITIHRMTNSYGSIHNVPSDAIDRMKENMVDVVGEIKIN